MVKVLSSSCSSLNAFLFLVWLFLFVFVPRKVKILYTIFQGSAGCFSGCFFSSSGHDRRKST